MKVYRVAQRTFVNNLSGEGASIAGGRWNSTGRAMLYTATSRSLCVLELLVHVSSDEIASSYVIIELLLPKSITTIRRTALPEDWRVFPHPISTRRIGDRFLQGMRQLAMKVPNAILPQESNVLVNPFHPLALSIEITTVEPLLLDPRLLKK
ncbi:MAG TPA: RES family NAD+ phosphorylase [Candidatus Kapabacteria bacterium]|jgi:RES domain-containing protein|nr:RES family NAD+ phosphorylase [Candidatus Kapabacteria bacterium]